MDPTKHTRASEIFLELCDLPPGDQDARLDAACAGDPELREVVRGLLAADRSPDTTLEPSRLGELGRELSRALSVDQPDQIGSYRILGELGRGGMGVVYDAEQESPRRRVALKVIRAGFAAEETLKRFEHEARVLGWLNHPGIAQIYDAGVAETDRGPQPYFAMELVRGIPITAFVEQSQSDLRDVLTLVESVARAVHHAHQKGVVHRDLKPANVLVDPDGVPKVLDFGVARAIESDLNADTLVTRTGELVGTLSYMAPEQVEGDPSRLDTRADVYALGVLAYELLSGRRPLELGQRSLPDAVVAIANEEPPPLGRVAPGVPSDVATIVGKALEKDRERRYPSAETLAEDIARFLRDEPIAARPPSTIYQAVKFARRNRALVGGLVATIVVLAVGVVVSTWQYVRAEAARRETADTLEVVRVERDTAEETSDFLVELFRVASPVETRGETITAKELLDRGAADIRHRLVDRPGVRSKLMGTMGRAYAQLNLLEEAEPLLTESLAIREEAFGPGSPEYAEALYHLAGLRMAQSAYAECAEQMERALALRLSFADSTPVEIARVEVGAAAALEMSGDSELSEQRARSAVDRLRTAPDVSAEDLADALRQLAYVLTETARHREALELLREAIDVEVSDVGERDTGVASTKMALGWALLRLERPEEAEPYFLEAHETLASIQPPGHYSLCNSTYNLGIAREALGDLDGAMELYRSSLDCWQAAVGEDHYGATTVLQGLANLLAKRGELNEAIELYERALALDEGVLAPDDRRLILERRELSFQCANLGRFDRAIELQEEIIASLEGSDASRASELGYALMNAGQMQRARGRDVEGEAYLAEAVEAFRRIDRAEEGRDEALASALGVHGSTLVDLERAEEGEPLLEEALEIRRSPGVRDAALAQSLLSLGRCRARLDEHDSAEALLLEATELAAELPDDANDVEWLRGASRRMLVELYDDLGRSADADAWRGDPTE